MKILVTGVNGQLGHDVHDELIRRGHISVPTDIEDLDITNYDPVMSKMEQENPDAVIHCAAWTAVDMAEEDKLVSKVYAVNSTGTRNIALACRSIGSKMIYVSTDYVFNGSGTKPWSPDCKQYLPLSVYGKSKLEGEIAVANTLTEFFIVRTAWLYGVNGNNFVKTMLRLSEKYDSVRVVNDQIGTPTYSYDLAGLLVSMAETDRYGYYHATNEGGYISWADFAQEIFRQAGRTTQVVPVSSVEYGVAKASRPMNSRLDKSKLKDNGFKPLPLWTEALSRYLAEIHADKTLIKAEEVKDK